MFTFKKLKQEIFYYSLLKLLKWIINYPKWCRLVHAQWRQRLCFTYTAEIHNSAAEKHFVLLPINQVVFYAIIYYILFIFPTWHYKKMCCAWASVREWAFKHQVQTELTSDDWSIITLYTLWHLLSDKTAVRIQSQVWGQIMMCSTY